MIVKCSVDWISATFPRNNMRPNDAMLGRWQFVGKGLHGYRLQWKDSITSATFQSDGAENMGSHLTLTGDTMHNLRINQTDDEIIAGLINREVKFSRVDLAYDIFGSSITPSQMALDHERGLLQTKARKAVLVRETSPGFEDRGQTLYIGNRQSDRFLRAYDKRQEQKIVDGEAWIRLELELKRLRANGAAQSVNENGLEPTVRGHMQDMFTYDNPEYIQAINGSSVRPEAIARKATNTEKWLLDTVSLTIAKCVNERPEFWSELLDKIAEQCTIVAKDLNNI